MILDREDDLGGTWYVNHYPGLAVDVPTTTYSYFFEPNPNWSRLFSTGAEIKQYADDVADKYDVRRHMRFGVTVEGARWDEEAKRWRVSLADGATLDGPVPDHRHRVPVPAARARHPGHHRVRRPDRPHHRLGRLLRSDRGADRHHRHRRDRGAADPRAGEQGRRSDGLPAHPDLGGAQDRLPLLRARQAPVRPGSVHPAAHSGDHRRDLRVHGLGGRRAPQDDTWPLQHRRGRSGQDAPVRHHP